MMNKLRNKSGETIAEVLVASLVVVLGILLYATMVSSSFRIVTKAEKAMQELYAAESDVEAGIAGTPEIKKATFTCTGISGFNGISFTGDITDVSVSVVGTNDIKSYKKK